MTCNTSSYFSAVRALGLSVVVVTAMALPAAAQPANAPANAPGNSQENAQPSNATPQAPMERVEQRRLAELHKRLRITPSEQAAWDRFAQASMQNAAQLDAAFRARAEQVPDMNAVQNMQSFADLDMRRAQDMQRLVPEFQELYAALSPSQQRSADELFRQGARRAQARANTRR